MLRPAGLAACLVASCGTFPDDPSWRDHLVASSPCFDVDLRDGLDTSSTGELRALFDCLNHHGHLTSLVPPMDALETATSRDGVPAGIEVARSVNALGEAHLDLPALVDGALGVLRAEDRPIDEILGVGLELIYGTRAGEVEVGTTPWTDPDALAAGVLAPLGPVLPLVAEALLDDDLDAASRLGDGLSDPETKRWIRTAVAWSEATHPDVYGPVRTLLPDLGDAVLATHSPGNDRWSAASGDSLRDAVTVALDTDLVEDLAPDLRALLDDSVVRSRMDDSLLALHRAGNLGRAVPQAVHLASVDRDGGSLSTGEDSALVSLLRLLHDTNRPMRCSLDLWVTTVDVDLGNLAVSMLELIATWDPGTVQSGVGVMGSLVGFPLTDALLDGIASTGLCPVLTHQVVDDLASIDRLADDEVYDLLVVLVEVLDLLRQGDGQGRIDELVDLVATVHEVGAVPPIEELLRDLGPTAVVRDALGLMPALVQPDAYGLRAGDDPVVDFQGVLDALGGLLEVEDGRTGWARLRPLVEPAARAPGTWTAVGNLAAVLARDGSHTGAAMDWLPRLVAADPELVLLDQIGPLIGDPEVAGPLLRALETPGVVSELLATRPTGDDPEVPMAFAGRLVVHGAVDDLLRVLDLVLSDLP